MIKTITLAHAKREAERFIKAVDDLGAEMYASKHVDSDTPPGRHSAAVKRASMDLSHALADLRLERLPGKRK